MADIKRPNYFTSQFLVEKDFNDEQAYHVNMRRRHNRLLHAFGVADGLLVTRAGPTSVLVSPGTAVDRDGREIVLQDARTFPLQTSGNNLDVFLRIRATDANALFAKSLNLGLRADFASLIEKRDLAALNFTKEGRV